jgi:hypothetical protein
MVAGWMVVRLARSVKVTVSAPVRVQAWPVTSRTVRPSGWRRHRICQSLTGSRALIGFSVAVAGW